MVLVVLQTLLFQPFEHQIIFPAPNRGALNVEEPKSIEHGRSPWHHTMVNPGIIRRRQRGYS